MISIQIDTGQAERLRAAVDRAGKSLPREISAAINQVARKSRLGIGRKIRQEVTIKKKESEQALKITSRASPSGLSSTIVLGKTPRLGLRHFGARQDKRGVSYKISKRGGRQRIEGAFQGPRPGVQKVSWRGNVFIREGKSRLPIRQIKGVSAWGVFVKNKYQGPQAKEIEAELRKQVERRINLNVLRAEGLVKS